VTPATPTPITGQPKGMMAAFLYRRGSLDLKTYNQIRVAEHVQRVEQARASERRHRARVMRPRVSGEFLAIPLANEASRVRIRASDQKRLKDRGYCGTGWVRDDESGAIRCHRYRLPRDHPDYGVWFDVAALLLGLKDGEAYTLTDPLDLTTVQVAK
jgi:hypothetical protein